LCAAADGSTGSFTGKFRQTSLGTFVIPGKQGSVML
jgi:hypothetical protein